MAKSSTTAFGVQFENVADGTAGIPLKSVVTVAAPYGAQSASVVSDQIWTFVGTEWVKYFYYTPNARKPTEGYWCLSTDATHQEIPDTVTLMPGQSFFFVRSNNSATSITLAGGVVGLDKTQTYSVAKSTTTAMAWPWPEAMNIKDFTKYNSAPYGAQSASVVSDQIWTFLGTEWVKYFYYTPNARKPTEGIWCLSTDSTHQETDAKIEAGSAFFFVRSNNSAATINFAR